MRTSQFIRRAIRVQKERGIKIVSLDFGLTIGDGPTRWLSAHGWCDPLGAVVLWSLPRPREGESIEDLSCRLLGRDRNWVESFISGYNRTDLPDEYELNKFAFKLGRQIRRENKLWRE